MATESPHITVLTVDDHAPFRSIARQVISAAGFDAIGEAGTGGDGVALAASLHPDIVLMDVRLPGMDGIEAARHIIAAHSARLVVLLRSDHEDQPVEGNGDDELVALPKERLRPAALKELWRDHQVAVAARAAGSSATTTR